ncbi:hypothetical protein MMC11_001478 [Xylographa trunciseda]|nr:hypothetical protein [Xylographa trunciseda]
MSLALFVGEVFSLTRLAQSHTNRIAARSNEPQPLSVPPSESFLGNDGPWSGFELRVGNPPQDVDVLVSTTGSETFVVVPGGCQPADPQTCPSNRGNIFDSSSSTTWAFKGNYTLSLEANLGLDSSYDVASYGLDDLGLGWQGGGLPTLHNQTIAGTTATDFWVGIFGISPYPTNLSDFNPHDSIPSYLQTLKTTNVVPSLSWGYTGGAQYRLKEALASLTFGGYDTSLFDPSAVSFDFGTDNSRDLSLYIQAIKYTDAIYVDAPLLPPDPGPFLTCIDSTVPAIWLPLTACQAFEKAFGLIWNDTYGYYFVDGAMHDSLTASNPNISFTLANTIEGGPTVDITLPYAAFDKNLSYGIGLSNNLPSIGSQRYFPLQRAANDTQYTLGKTFLQEAYIITDYERRNFSVNPCIWKQGAQQNLVPICSVNATGCISPMGSRPQVAGGVSNSTPLAGTKQTLGSGSIAGTVVGLVLIVSIPLIILWVRHRRRLLKAKREESNGTSSSSWPGHGTPEEARKAHSHIPEIDSSPIAEMTGSVTFPAQLCDDAVAAKIEYCGEDQHDQAYELPADMTHQRQQSRPFDRSRRSRHKSTGQDSANSGLSELSDGDDSAVPRPTLSHRRTTSEVSEKSNVSDLSTLRDEAQSASAASPRVVSPIHEDHQEAPLPQIVIVPDSEMI